MFIFVCAQHSFASQTYSEQLQRVTNNEQLSQSFIVKSLQDDNGYVWIATTEGLYRFDGYQVTPYESELGLKNNYINSIYKAIDGQILVNKCREFATILKALKPKENWRTNAYVKTTKAEKHPIHLSATAVANEKDKVSYYVIVITDLTEQKRAENELRYLANYDALTGLPNRSLMNQKSKMPLQAPLKTIRNALLYL